MGRRSKSGLKRVLRRLVLVVGCVAVGVVLVAGSLAGVWFLRSNGSVVDPGLVVETWDVVNDEWHNSNTDMIYWNGRFYLIYASSPYHFATDKSRLNLVRSEDAREWDRVATFDAGGEDIRDPKFAIIGGRMFLYALKNVDFAAEPYGTVYAVSDDGVSWSTWRDVEPKGWLLWRPKQSGNAWFVPAYWHEHGKSVLLRSTDGVDWSIHSVVHEGDQNDETDIEFLADGRMIATARLEVSDSYFGHRKGCTLVAVSEPPFEEWGAGRRSHVTRLDGPNLFSYNGEVYAVGRYQPYTGGLLGKQGSILSRKRTSLFLVREDGLARLSDLPSAGDTSYAGVVVRGDDLYVCYYTSDVEKDYPWIVGMLRPSSVRMAKVSLPSLEALAG